MSNCTKSQIVCEHPTNTDHTCPMTTLDGKTGLCRCCQVCKNGCKTNVDHQLKVR